MGYQVRINGLDDMVDIPWRLLQAEMEEWFWEEQNVQVIAWQRPLFIVLPHGYLRWHTHKHPGSVIALPGLCGFLGLSWI